MKGLEGRRPPIMSPDEAIGIHLNVTVVSRARVGPIFVDIAPFLVANVVNLALICLFLHQIMWTLQAFFG